MNEYERTEERDGKTVKLYLSKGLCRKCMFRKNCKDAWSIVRGAIVDCKQYRPERKYRKKEKKVKFPKRVPRRRIR